MRLRDFIRENRGLIDNIVYQEHNIELTNDKERSDWINNLESLYIWARNSGVRL